MSKVKALLAEYEIGFVTHGKDVNEHLKKFESALDTLFTEQMRAVVGEPMKLNELQSLTMNEKQAKHAYKGQCVLVDEQLNRLEESRKELFDE